MRRGWHCLTIPESEWTPEYQGPAAVGHNRWGLEICPSCATRTPPVCEAAEAYALMDSAIFDKAYPHVPFALYEAVLTLRGSWAQVERFRVNNPRK